MMKIPKLKNVYRDKVAKLKFVITSYNIGKVIDNHDKFEFVCEKPHADNDFSYTCGSGWCRCMS